MRRWQRVVSVLAAVVVFATTYALVLPAITLDKETASTQAGMEIAASENEPGSDGTVYEAEEEAEEAPAEEESEAEETVAEEPQAEEAVAEDSSADSGSQEAEAAEDTSAQPTEENTAVTEENTEASENASAAEEEADALSTEETASDEATEEAAAAATEEIAEEVELITEDTQLIYEDAEGEYVVYADFGEAAKLPVGVELQVEEITEESDPEAYAEYYEKALAEMQDRYEEKTELSFAKFYDIAFVYEGAEIEPQGNVNVRIEYKEALEIKTNESVETIHFDNKNNEKVEVIESDRVGSETSVDAVEFESDQFSVYGIVGTSVRIDFLTADGKTLTVTVTFDENEVIPEGASLEITEVTQEDEAYPKRSERLAGVLSEKYGNVTISDVHFTSIRIMADGVEYEPEYPVEVKVEYKDELYTENTAEYIFDEEGDPSVVPELENTFVAVHYGKNGGEILESTTESTDTGITESVSITPSFSDYDYAYIYQYETYEAGDNYNLSAGSLLSASDVSLMAEGETEDETEDDSSMDSCF